MKPFSADYFPKWNKRSYFPKWNKRVRFMIVTDLEFYLRTARAALQTAPDKATHFVQRGLESTADPRLARRLRTILVMLKSSHHAAAARWLNRAIAYDTLRRKGRHAAP